MILPMHVVKHEPHSYLIKIYWPALVFKIMFVSLYNFYIKLERADNKFFLDLEWLCLYSVLYKQLFSIKISCKNFLIA